MRLDLRLADNPALAAAVHRGGPVIPVFIWAPDEEGDWPPGAASKWWLHHSLASLQTSFRQIGSELIIRRGPVAETLRQLAKETGAEAVFWNQRYEPALLARDKSVQAGLHAEGIAVESFNSALLFEPGVIKNKSGKAFQVFTPFWKHCLTAPEPATPLKTPARLSRPAQWPKSISLEDLELEPRAAWTSGLRSSWQPGESSAAARFSTFLDEQFAEYTDQRNRPDRSGTSRLSPHLHFGEISPRQIWHGVKQRAAESGNSTGWRDAKFLGEIGWREFAHHLLFHFPRTPDEPLRSEFKHMEWRSHPAWLRAWQRGRTGYPIVDAGMRELWGTGWMHNRVRMVAASFLVKDLLLSWQEGAKWFWDTLVDADLAQNTLGWQWSAGCGADAAPYFRVFNPQNQAEKFDPAGSYVRRWCPELSNLPAPWIYRPHDAPLQILKNAGIELDRNYPRPIVNHSIAREVALEAYSKMRKSLK